MESRYEMLVRIVFRHDYFLKRRFDRIVAEPTVAMRSLFLDYGLLFRPDVDGFRILFDTLWGGGLRKRDDLLKEGLTLLFQLMLNDQDFYTYTDLAAGDLTRSYFYLSNVAPAGGERKMPGLLHDGDFVTDENRVVFGKLPRHFSGQPFGWLQLELVPTLKDTYEARWPVRSVYWNYIVVSEHLQELDKPAVLDPVTKQVFAGPKPILLPDNRPALSFVSEKPISFLAAEKQLFQLVKDFDAISGKYKVVLSALPRADPSILSNGGSPAGREENESQAGDGTKKPTAYFSEIFIY